MADDLATIGIAAKSDGNACRGPDAFRAFSADVLQKDPRSANACDGDAYVMPQFRHTHIGA